MSEAATVLGECPKAAAVRSFNRCLGFRLEEHGGYFADQVEHMATVAEFRGQHDVAKALREAFGVGRQH